LAIRRSWFGTVKGRGTSVGGLVPVTTVSPCWWLTDRSRATDSGSAVLGCVVGHRPGRNGREARARQGQVKESERVGCCFTSLSVVLRTCSNVGRPSPSAQASCCLPTNGCRTLGSRCAGFLPIVKLGRAVGNGSGFVSERLPGVDTCSPLIETHRLAKLLPIDTIPNRIRLEVTESTALLR